MILLKVRNFFCKNDQNSHILGRPLARPIRPPGTAGDMATLAGLVLVQLRMVWAVTVMAGLPFLARPTWLGLLLMPAGPSDSTFLPRRSPATEKTNFSDRFRNKGKGIRNRNEHGGEASPSVERSRRVERIPPKPPTPGRAREHERRSGCENDGRRRCGPRRRGHPPRGISNP